MKRRQILNLIALIATVAVNGLANALPLNGQTTGDVADQIPTLFTPAGYVFGIWSVIYLGLLAFAIYQALPRQRDRSFLDRIGYWFVISCLFNSAWIFLWHYELFVPTLIAMVGLLISLIAIYLRLDIGRRPVPRAVKWLVHVPFSIYLGWISVATIANVSVALYTLGWGGWGIAPEAWTVLVLIVGAALGIAMILTRGEVAYPLVIAWAFIGVVVRRSDAPLIAITAGAATGLMLIVLAAFRLLRRPRASGTGAA
jgi:hypothetical protein